MLVGTRSQSGQRFPLLARLKVDLARPVLLLYQDGEQVVQRLETGLQCVEALLACFPLLGRRWFAGNLLNLPMQRLDTALMLNAFPNRFLQRTICHFLAALPITQYAIQTKSKASHHSIPSVSTSNSWRVCS